MCFLLSCTNALLFNAQGDGAWSRCSELVTLISFNLQNKYMHIHKHRYLRVVPISSFWYLNGWFELKWMVPQLYCHELCPSQSVSTVYAIMHTSLLLNNIGTYVWLNPAAAGPPRHPPAAGGHILAPFSSSQYLRNAKAWKHETCTRIAGYT